MRTRVYRLNVFKKAVVWIVFLVFLIFATAIWTEVLIGQREAKFVELVGSLFGVLLVGYMCFHAMVSTLTVTDNSVELKTGWGKQCLPKARIRGRRKRYSPGDGEGQGEWYLKLESDDDRFPTLEFEQSYDFDSEFNRWFESLTNLDELDQTRPKPSNFGLV